MCETIAIPAALPGSKKVVENAFMRTLDATWRFSKGFFEKEKPGTKKPAEIGGLFRDKLGLSVVMPVAHRNEA